MSLHPYFHQVAQQWLEDQQLPESLVKRYVLELAERLEDDAEDFLGTLGDREHERTEAARDAYIDRQLDELRGK